MPELPEVETTRRGIAPHVTGAKIVDVIVRDARLRWPVPRGLRAALLGQSIHDIQRRAKYLLFRLDPGWMIAHLGMSGSLRIVRDAPPGKHDHLDIVFETGKRLRLRDPRRFGAVLWTTRDPARHKLLRSLGPEPLGDELNGDYFFQRSRGRTVAVKNFIMDSRNVVGVGNIYANEALFGAGIHPHRPAGRIALPRYGRLAETIRAVLKEAVRLGGTTLRDFTSGIGEPGYFSQSLKVYDREGEACATCGTPIRALRVGQRSSFYCPRCQK